MIDPSGVSRATLQAKLNLSPSALSELLNGQRAKAPDWDVVETIVRTCLRARRPPVTAAEVASRLASWKDRHEELESELERLAVLRTSAPPPEPDTAPRELPCPICQNAYADESADAVEWEPGTFNGAASILATQGHRVRSEVEVLCDSEGALRSREDLDAVRDQFADIERSLLAGLGTRVRLACHPHRVRMLHAAHTLLIIECWVGSPVLELVWGADAHRVGPDAQVDLVDVFYGCLGDGAFTSAPLPVANVAYADHHARVVEHYTGIGAELFGNVFSDNHPALRELDRLSARTAALYEARLAELAVECPELFVWAGLQDGPDAMEALRSDPGREARGKLADLYRELRTQKRGLDGLETLLRVLARATTPEAWPARLSAIYRKDLAQPISPVGEMDRGQPGPRIPRLDQGYVNPAFRTAVYSGDARPHVDSWWNTRPLRGEIQGFLAGHLAGFPAANRPLVILGDPGAGKSLLTRLLAARLPPQDYLPIRVELRKVNAEADVLEQIGQALRLATHKASTWEAVTESTPGVLPVLIFDGLDELLQAGGPEHWAYLEDIAEFQRVSADNGLPVAAIVTSRTVVADQTRFPSGTVIIRLEPFDAVRIARWTETWNTANTRYFRDHGIAPLPDGMGDLYPTLATQPLLLLMLALYQAVEPDTPLSDAVGLSRVDLYERLLRLFVRRQIAKLEPKLRPALMDERIESELDLLAVIAVAMFNRGSQGVSAKDADFDLRYLRAPWDTSKSPEARLLFGRFFFIHEAKATFEDGGDQRWYEFLHATFGEYLVARKVADTLARISDQGPYHRLLFDLLSFAPLTDRAQIIDDLHDLPLDSATAHRLFPEALHERTQARPRPGDPGYTTGRVPVPYRHACYSANLVLLAMAPGRVIRFSELAADAADPVDCWRSHATLWHSQFPADSWDAFTRAVGAVPLAESHPHGDRRGPDIALLMHQQDAPPTADNLAWTMGVDGSRPTRLLRREGDALTPLHRSRLLYDRDTEFVLDPGLPVFAELPALANVVTTDGLGHEVSGAHALVSLLLCGTAPHEDLQDRYDTCLRMLEFLPDDETKARLTGLIARRLGSESERLPTDWVAETVRALSSRASDRPEDPAADTATRISLLVCTCRLIARTGWAGGEELIHDLLGMPAPRRTVRPLTAASGTHLLLESLLGRMLGPDGGAPAPTIALSRLLSLAVALDDRAWTAEHAARVLARLDAAALAAVPRHDAEYLLSAIADPPPGLTERLGLGTVRPHP